MRPQEINGSGSGGHEESIHHAWKPIAPHIKARPLERGAVGQHFASLVDTEEMPPRSFGRAA